GEEQEAPDERERPRPMPARQRPIVTGGYQIASRNRRVGGFMVDWIVLNSWTILATRAGAPTWAIVGTLGLYTVATTTLLGRTLGKYVAGTVVIDTRTGRQPGWIASLVRWLLVWWLNVLYVFVPVVPTVIVFLAGVLLVITYAPIFWDPRGRGWH